MPALSKIVAVTFLVTAAEVASAQTMVTTSTPLQTNSESFFESSGVGWSVRGPGFFASFGGGGPMPVPFGGFNPNAGIRSGWSVRNGDWTTNFNFHFAQGTQRFSSTTAPVLTSIPGQPASFFSGVQRPFVVGLQPIVPGGGFGFGPQFSVPTGSFQMPGAGLSPVQQALANGFRPKNLGQEKSEEKREPPRTANAQDRSNAAFAFFGGSETGTQQPARVSVEAPTGPVAENSTGPSNVPPARSLNDQLVDLYFRKGQSAEAAGDLQTARSFYEKSLSKAVGRQRHLRAQQKLDALRKR